MWRLWNLLPQQCLSYLTQISMSSSCFNEYDESRSIYNEYDFFCSVKRRDSIFVSVVRHASLRVLYCCLRIVSGHGLVLWHCNILLIFTMHFWLHPFLPWNDSLLTCSSTLSFPVLTSCYKVCGICDGCQFKYGWSTPGQHLSRCSRRCWHGCTKCSMRPQCSVLSWQPKCNHHLIAAGYV